MSNSGRGRGSRGRGRGGGRGGSGAGGGQDVAELKESLQKSIANAEKLLQKIEVKEKKNPRQHDKEKATRGSKSMSNLSSDGGSQNRKRNDGKGNQDKRGMIHQQGHQPMPLMGIPLSGNQPRPLLGNHPGSGYHFVQQNQHNYPSPFESGHSFAQQGNPPFHPRPSSPNFFFNTPPPPTYEESIGVTTPNLMNSEEFKKTDKKPAEVSNRKKPSQKLTPDILVKTLAIFRGQFEKADTIGRHLDRQPEDVVNCANSRKDIFSVMGKGKDAMIELVPKISLCSDYFTEKSCNAKETCGNLHICKTFVTGYCNAGASCEYGHRWDTNQNSKVLSKFYLDLIQRETLRQVIRKLYKVGFKLKICLNYNADQGCKYEACRWLHICKSYVLGSGKCTVKGCSLNHNIIDKQCSSLLKASGISLNESPRDILLNLVSSLDLAKERTEDEVPANTKKVKAVSKADSTSDDSCDSDQSSYSKDSDVKGKQSSKKKRRNKKKQKTVSATDLIGDVVVPEICVFSVVGNCKNEEKGCKYLHAKSLFHWQVEKDKWYNLRVFQSKKLETAYRNVYQASTDLPALDQEKLEDHAKELMNVLGTNSWKADFQTLVVTNGDSALKIRRLSTQSAASFNHPKATVFVWYCQRDKGKWIEYGKADVNEKEHISNISSEEIEKQYVSDPSSSMLIFTGEDKFKLEFSRMVQVNVTSGQEKEIRRRPAGLKYQKIPAGAAVADDEKSSLPSHWSPMPVDHTHMLVELDHDSSEYLEVASRIRLTLPTAFIVSIKRLQNPYLWRLLQYRKAELSKRYDENQLNMQKLFHGVSPRDTETICKENFDWRQKEAFTQDFGQGTYFSNSAAVGRTYCNPDEFGRNHMFLAQVIIGTVTKGDASYTRPPLNPSTDHLYDTTVDNMITPTVYVKYDKGEYYPEYIIEFY